MVECLQAPPNVAPLRSAQRLKTTTLPSIRVEPDFRAEVAAVPAEGETLSLEDEADVAILAVRHQLEDDCHGGSLSRLLGRAKRRYRHPG